MRKEAIQQRKRRKRQLNMGTEGVFIVAWKNANPSSMKFNELVFLAYTKEPF